MTKHIDHPFGHDLYREQVYIALCQPDTVTNTNFCVLWEHRALASCEACILLAFQMSAEEHTCNRPNCYICKDKAWTYDISDTRHE